MNQKIPVCKESAEFKMLVYLSIILCVAAMIIILAFFILLRMNGYLDNPLRGFVPFITAFSSFLIVCPPLWQCSKAEADIKNHNLFAARFHIKKAKLALVVSAIIVIGILYEVIHIFFY